MPATRPPMWARCQTPFSRRYGRTRIRFGRVGNVLIQFFGYCRFQIDAWSFLTNLVITRNRAKTRPILDKNFIAVPLDQYRGRWIWLKTIYDASYGRAHNRDVDTSDVARFHIDWSTSLPENCMRGFTAVPEQATFIHPLLYLQARKEAKPCFWHHWAQKRSIWFRFGLRSQARKCAYHADHCRTLFLLSTFTAIYVEGGL